MTFGTHRYLPRKKKTQPSERESLSISQKGKKSTAGWTRTHNLSIRSFNTLIHCPTGASRLRRKHFLPCFVLFTWKHLHWFYFSPQILLVTCLLKRKYHRKVTLIALWLLLGLPRHFHMLLCDCLVLLSFVVCGKKVSFFKNSFAVLFRLNMKSF